MKVDINFEIHEENEQKYLIDKCLEAKQKYNEQFHHDPVVLIMNKQIGTFFEEIFNIEEIHTFFGTPVIITPLEVVEYF